MTNNITSVGTDIFEATPFGKKNKLQEEQKKAFVTICKNFFGLTPEQLKDLFTGRSRKGSR